MQQIPSVATEVDDIVVEHLTKKFTVSHSGSIKRALLNIMQPKKYVRFTALNDISFRVPHGQTLAVVGHNGSGKSTLLGILANVYKPTSGKVTLRGRNGGRPRIAPLLELGAGFHMDLTGTENVEFYAAVLGMKRNEIASRFSEIVAFAELEDKIDTPLRGWNDGAKLRLGFSIAIHTDPDIMLVDEVLAVGDEEFKNKCYQRVEQMQAEGRTIIFISHELPVVERVAMRAIWLDRGVIRMDGPMEPVLTAYKEASRIVS